MRTVIVARRVSTCSNGAVAPLETIDKAILAAHTLLAVGVWLVGFVSFGDSEGWAGLARAALTVLAAGYLAGVGLAWALMRFAMGGRAARLALALSSPPVTLLIVLLAVRAG